MRCHGVYYRDRQLAVAAGTITAARLVSHPPERVYAFVADIENHRQLSDPHLHLDELNRKRSGGRITISGPLGLRRTAWMTVTVKDAPHCFGGSATVGNRTRAHADWRIEATQHGARVVLESGASTSTRSTGCCSQPAGAGGFAVPIAACSHGSPTRSTPPTPPRPSSWTPGRSPPFSRLPVGAFRRSSCSPPRAPAVPSRSWTRRLGDCWPAGQCHRLYSRAICPAR